MLRGARLLQGATQAQPRRGQTRKNVVEGLQRVADLLVDLFFSEVECVEAGLKLFVLDRRFGRSVDPMREGGYVFYICIGDVVLRDAIARGLAIVSV